VGTKNWGWWRQRQPRGDRTANESPSLRYMAAHSRRRQECHEPQGVKKIALSTGTNCPQRSQLS
ncbi:unnamed protein product, partial [Ectocarpus sp. 12 AP-2014]